MPRPTAPRTGPLLLFVAAAFLVIDAVLVIAVAPRDFAFDFTCCYQQAADRVLTDPATLYDWSTTYTFRYTPLGALPFIPLVPLSAGVAAWAWLGFKVGLLVVAAAWFSRPWTGRERWLAALAVIAFPPIVHDLVLGNVSTITLLAFLAASRWTGARGGVVIGLISVLMPKPHLIPVLVYLAVRRPAQFASAVATMGFGLLIGVVVFGIQPWIDFVATLREPLERTFTANVGFSGLLGPIGVVVGVLAALVVLVAAVRLGGVRGYGLSIVSGIVLGPYTFIHYLAGTIVAAEPVLRTRPRLLAPFPWLMVVFPLIPIWLGGLAWVIGSSPSPEVAEAAPRAAGPG